MTQLISFVFGDQIFKIQSFLGKIPYKLHVNKFNLIYSILTVCYQKMLFFYLYIFNNGEYLANKSLTTFY